jgi:hypothetical protein
MVMRKSMMGTVLALSMTTRGISSHPLPVRSPDVDRSEVPKACFFFAPQKISSDELAEEREYDTSISEVYEQWCTPNHGSRERRTAAVDRMVKRWKAVWDRDDSFNAAFHEAGASDLLELIGLTHELPARMVSDPAFTKEWAKACANSCFTIWGVPENQSEEHALAMRLWLRNDVLDNLKKESASEPVVKMLEEAQFRLVD